MGVGDIAAGVRTRVESVRLLAVRVLEETKNGVIGSLVDELLGSMCLLRET